MCRTQHPSSSASTLTAVSFYVNIIPCAPLGLVLGDGFLFLGLTPLLDGTTADASLSRILLDDRRTTEGLPSSGDEFMRCRIDEDEAVQLDQA